MKFARLGLLFAGGLLLSIGILGATPSGQPEPPLGLPPVPIPDDNPQGDAKVALGKKLYEEKRFSSDGTVACATCHALDKVFTDTPLKVSEGVRKLKGTRNAPTVVNSVYYPSQFWDGRSPTLEDQALHPFINPVEHGLPSHEPILRLVRSDGEYRKMFRVVYGKTGKDITMGEVTGAIAAFERTVVSGNSPFDRYYFAGEQDALTPAQKRGFDLFVNKGRCVSCHVVEQTTALFTDGRFHNIGVGITGIQEEVPGVARMFLKAKATLSEVDKKVLSDPKTSELGRFAITRTLDDMGAFKTPTLRNVALTPPYMHDGSLATLADVVTHYNLGGVSVAGDRENDFLSGGIRPLDLEEAEVNDLVAFMEALTSPEFASQAKAEPAAGKEVAP